MALFDFAALQNTLKSMGFYDFVLPWLLAFAVVFGILQTVKIFKKGNDSNTSVDAVVAMVAAFYLTIFTPYSGFLSSFFSKLFGSSIVVLSGILVLLMFIGIFGLRLDEFFFEFEGEGASRKIKKTKGMTYVLLIAAFVVAASLFISANSGVFAFGGSGFNTSELLTMLVFFGIIGAVIWFVVNGSKTAE